MVLRRHHSASQDEDEEDEDDEDALSNLPSVAACQAIDTLAVNLPPDKFMPALLSHVQPGMIL